MTDHLKDPQAVSWGDLAEDFAFTDAEKDQIQKGAQAMVLASRVHRLAELRKRQHTTQVQVAEAMGVTQARVSRIEKGQLERSEVDTLAAYVKALGGKLKIVADFGDETYVLGRPDRSASCDPGSCAVPGARSPLDIGNDAPPRDQGVEHHLVGKGLRCAQVPSSWLNWADAAAAVVGV